MSKFIEIINNQGKRVYVNVNYIESVDEMDENQCSIFMLGNFTNETMRDYFVVDKPYDEVVSMLKGGESDA